MTHISQILLEMKSLITQLNLDVATISKQWMPSLTPLVVRTRDLGLGSKTIVDFPCGCWWDGWSSKTDPTVQKAATVNYCSYHSKEQNTLSRIHPHSSNYSCPNEDCEYPLEEGEDFDGAMPSEERHPEVPPPNIEYFSGFCDGMENCPICGSVIDYDPIYQQWCEDKLSAVYDAKVDRESDR